MNEQAAQIVIAGLQALYFLAMTVILAGFGMTVFFLMEYRSQLSRWDQRRKEWLQFCMFIQFIGLAAISFAICSGVWELLRR